MKKSLLALILAVAMVVPAFAAKGDKSINAKLGLGVNSNVTVSGDVGEMFASDDIFMGLKNEMPFMLGAEFFYGLMDNLNIGAGFTYVFNSSTKMDIIDGGKAEGGTTNIYIAVKPEAKIESDIFTSVYLIGQIGLSMGRVEADGQSISLDNGIYLGAGFGTTIKDNFLVELLFSSSNGSYSEHGRTMDFQYSITALNIGYKFAL